MKTEKMALKELAEQRRVERFSKLARIYALHAEGLTSSMIGQRVGMSAHVVSDRLRAAGLTPWRRRDEVASLYVYGDGV